MAIYKEDIVNIELETGKVYRSFMNHTIGLGDAKANRFGVRLFRKGEPVEIGNSAVVQGLFMNPAGTNILVSETGYTGSTGIEGNVAYVQLPSACYAVEGQFCLAIKITSGSVTGTMRIIDGVIWNTGATGAVVPTGQVPSSAEIIAAYEEAVAVMSYSVRYDASQSLTDTQKGTARTNIDAVGTSDLSGVKTELETEDAGITKLMTRILPDNACSGITSGKYCNKAGTYYNSDSYGITNFCEVEPGYQYKFYYSTDSGATLTAVKCRFVTAFNANKEAVSASGAENVNAYTVPAGIKYIIVSYPIAKIAYAVVTRQALSAYVAYQIPYYIAKDGFIEDSSLYTDVDCIKAKMVRQMSKNRIESITDGKYYNKAGTQGNNADLCVTGLCEVKPGEQVKFYYINNGTVATANSRFVTAYNASKEPVADAGTEYGSAYNVPSGIRYIRVTFQETNNHDLMITNETPTAYVPYQPYYTATEEFVKEANAYLEQQIRQISSVGLITKEMEDGISYYVDSDSMYVAVTLTNTSTGIAYLFHNPNTGSIGGSAVSVDFANGTINFYKAFGVFSTSGLVLSESRAMTVARTSGHTYMIQYSRSGITPMYTVKVTDMNTMSTQTETKSADVLGNGWGKRGYSLTGCTLVSAEYQCDEPQSPKALILGDSYTEGWTIWSQRNKRWAYLLKEEVGNIAINAQGGATAANILNWWSDYLKDLFYPGYVILECGVNGTYAAYETAMDELIPAIENAGAIPILCTVPPTQNHADPSDWNTYVLGSGYRYIDIARALTVNGDRATQDLTLFLDDQIHPTVAGHQRIYEMALMNVPELLRK